MGGEKGRNLGGEREVGGGAGRKATRKWIFQVVVCFMLLQSSLSTVLHHSKIFRMT